MAHESTIILSWRARMLWVVMLVTGVTGLLMVAALFVCMVSSSFDRLVGRIGFEAYLLPMGVTTFAARMLYRWSVRKDMQSARRP